MALSKALENKFSRYPSKPTLEQSKKKIGGKMDLASSNLTEDKLEDMLEQGQGAQLVGHVHIEGDADQF